jgi:hypothetical protein
MIQEAQYQLNLALLRRQVLFLSNKSSNNSNKVVGIISELQSGNKNESDVRTYFDTLAKRTTNQDLNGYIKDVLNLENKVLEQFFINVFHLDDDDIITKCKAAVKSKMILQNKIEQAFKMIDSTLRSDNFLQIKDKVKIEISFDEFYEKYRRYFDIFRNESLIVQEYKGVLPDKLEDQIFIRQLLEIGFVEIGDFEYISRLTLFKLKLLNNLEAWKREGEITDIEIKRFKENAYNLWDTEFRLHNMELFSEEYNNKGKEVLRSVLKHSFNLSGQELDVDMCNGKFYSLSDEPIGWRKDCIIYESRL